MFGHTIDILYIVWRRISLIGWVEPDPLATPQLEEGDHRDIEVIVDVDLRRRDEQAHVAFAGASARGVFQAAKDLVGDGF